jgi:hypothetical protein
MKEIYYPVLSGFAAILAYLAFMRSHSVKDLRGKLPTNGNGWNFRPLQGVTDITIHHSAGGSSETIQGIANYHVSRRTSSGEYWKGIAYHYIISKGKIYQTNDLTAKSYHNGFNNTAAIGICIMGNYDVIQPKDEDINALKWLILKLKRDNDLPRLNRLIGHREYKNTTACPGRFIDLDTLRNDTKMNGLSSVPMTLYGNFMGAVGYEKSEADN